MGAWLAKLFDSFSNCNRNDEIPANDDKINNTNNPDKYLAKQTDDLPDVYLLKYIKNRVADDGLSKKENVGIVKTLTIYKNGLYRLEQSPNAVKKGKLDNHTMMKIRTIYATRHNLESHDNDEMYVICDGFFYTLQFSDRVVDLGQSVPNVLQILEEIN